MCPAASVVQSYGQLLGSLLSVLGALCLAVLFYRLHLHPLSRVPGPSIAAISSVWYACQVRNGRAFALGSTLHRKYGPIVRVSPNEVWFDSVDGFKSIYGSGSGYKKADFYLATMLHQPRVDTRFRVVSPDTLDLLSERNMARYHLQRRLIGPLFQPASLAKFENTLDEVIGRVRVQLRNLEGNEVDLKEWMHIITVECLGAVTLSWSPGFLKDKSDGSNSTQAYLSWKRKSVLGLFPWAVVARSYSKMFGRVFAKIWGLTYKTPAKFKTFFTPVYQRSSRRISAALRPYPPPDTRRDLLADLIQLHKDKPEFTETYLRRMTTTNFGAGHETTTSALTAALAMIGTHANVQRRIVTEIRTLSTTGLISYHDAVNLRLTVASIKEAQRLHPVIGMALPRRVPSGGLRVHGHYFPPGTTVGCNPAALHRNRDIFGPNPDEFRPERWLGEDAQSIAAMERYNLTWGGGARRCPGRNLAAMILYKVVPALIHEFDIRATVPPVEEMPFYFMAMLTGVKVKFVPRDVTQSAL